MKKYKNLILKIIVSSALLAIIFFQIDLNTLVKNFSLLNPVYIPFIILLLIANYVFSSIRWKALLIFNNSHHIRLKYLIHLYFTGAFFNNFMPTSIGGDVYKVYKLGKKTGNTVDAFSATFMERFTGVLALVFISIFGLIRHLGLWGAILLVIFIFGIIIGFYLFSFLSGQSEKIKKIYDSLNAYRGKNLVLTTAMATSFVVQIIAIATQYLIFVAMGIDLPFIHALIVFPIITLASFFIPSLNGIGVQDSLYMKLFLIVGIAEPVSLSASIIYHLFRLGVSLIGGIIYAMGKDS